MPSESQWIVLKNGKQVKTEFSFLSQGDAQRFALEASHMEYGATFCVAQITVTCKKGAVSP